MRNLYLAGIVLASMMEDLKCDRPLEVLSLPLSYLKSHAFVVTNKYFSSPK